MTISPEERKRQRLEAWKKKQEAKKKQQQDETQGGPTKTTSSPPVSISLKKPIVVAKAPVVKPSFNVSGISSKRASINKKKRKRNLNPFDDDDDDGNQKGFGSANDDNGNTSHPRKRPLLPLDGEYGINEPKTSETAGPSEGNSAEKIKPPSRKKRRWDTKATPSDSNKNKEEKKGSNAHIGKSDMAAATTTGTTEDALDKFMDKLTSGEMGQVVTLSADLSIQVSGSMMNKAKSVGSGNVVSGGVITAEQLFSSPGSAAAASLRQSEQHRQQMSSSPSPSQQPMRYDPSDWMSDTGSTAPSDNEEEEQARRAFIEALKQAPVPTTVIAGVEGTEGEDPKEASEGQGGAEGENEGKVIELAAEVKSEKHRRELIVQQLEKQAAIAKKQAVAAAAPEFGRFLESDEAGVMEEAERLYQVANANSVDALTVLHELNKKKELGNIDHSNVDYLSITKNLYRVPPSLNLSNDEIINRRAKQKVRVRGHGAPAPVSTFSQCGLSEKVLTILESQKIYEPFPIQAQCIPTIMAGRDVIGIAKTGSGKTLAYLLPLIRHILAQPPLAPNESGPIGLILAPARELAFQIHLVCKQFTKSLGLKSTAIYGGAGVAEQISDLKRGTHIVVATPGRLIDILTMQSGKILSLQRVSYVVMDEADRMYDMGFAPQITAVLKAVRPDRQTVLFSATFPKAVESLARQSLQYPIEVIVGGRSVASDNVTQYAELVEEEDKFLRLLQILGEQVDTTKKAIVFVDTQVRCDTLFEQLLRNGYPSLSLHGGKEQEDRDSTISDFKRKDGPNVLVATGVAGRGLDVPDCCCVVNFSSPNHLEAYVHQVGRTGRAGNKGFSYTFVNSTEEEKFAPIIVRALSEAGQSENISKSLKALSEDFKAKVEKGLAKFAGSGFKGKGYTYDSTELSEAQRIARIEKRNALIEAGMLDPDEDDPLLSSVTPTKAADQTAEEKQEASSKSAAADSTAAAGKDGVSSLPIEIPENLTPEMLALPGMKEALLRKAGILSVDDTSKKTSAAGAKEADQCDPKEQPVKLGDNHWLREFEINDYPREARWKVTQRETTSRLQDEFRTAVTLKGSYFPPGKDIPGGERRLYLHLEAASEISLQNCVLEIQRLLNEETIRVTAKQSGVGGGSSGGSSKYNVL